MDDPPDQRDEEHRAFIAELARRVYASVSSMQYGVSVRQAYDRYAKGQKVGEFWLQQAEIIWANWSERVRSQKLPERRKRPRPD